MGGRFFKGLVCFSWWFPLAVRGNLFFYVMKKWCYLIYGLAFGYFGWQAFSKSSVFLKVKQLLKKFEDAGGYTMGEIEYLESQGIDTSNLPSRERDEWYELNTRPTNGLLKFKR